MGEYVYAGTRTLSYLDWQLIPLATLGAGIEGTAPWGTAVGTRAALPLTRISYHTAVVDTHREVDVWLTQRLLRGRVGSVMLGIGYRDRFVKMNARNGSYDYGDTSGDVTGVVITYQQHHRIPYIVLAAASPGPHPFTVGVSFSPYVAVDALDHHHRRLLDFYDTVRRALWFKADLGISFELSGQTIEVAGYGELIPETNGNTTTVDYTTDELEGTVGTTFTDGAGVSWWSVGVQVSLGFGWRAGGNVAQPDRARDTIGG
jgi:outer membrane protease